MSVDLVAEIKVTHQAWIPDYVSHVHDIVHKHGGKYLSRSANIKSVEGERPDATVVALLTFPSMEAVEAFAKDPAYAPYAKARQAGSVSKFYLIDDTDVAGTIPFLPKRSAWVQFSSCVWLGHPGGPSVAGIGSRSRFDPVPC